MQPQVAKEIDGAFEAILANGIPTKTFQIESQKLTLAEEVKNGGQITRQFSIESETVLLKDFTEVANLKKLIAFSKNFHFPYFRSEKYLDGAFAFLIERSENLFDLCHLSLTLRGNLEN